VTSEAPVALYKTLVELFPGELKTEGRYGVYRVEVTTADSEFLGDVLAVVGEQQPLDRDRRAIIVFVIRTIQ